MKKKRLLKIKHLVLILLCFFALTFLALCVISRNSAAIRSAAEEYICYPMRAAIAAVSSLIPIPVFELLVILLPIPIFISVIKFSRRGGIPVFPILLLALLSVTYAITLGVGGGVDSEALSAENDRQDLICAEEYLLERVNTLSLSVDCESLDVKAVRDFLGERTVIPKRSLFPRLLTRSRIFASLYFPTVEIVFNGSAPSFVSVFSVAHEIMHFRGVVREDEATLYAYLALSESNDAHLSYSASLYAFIIIGRGLDSAEYSSFVSRLHALPRAQLLEYYDFVSKGNTPIGRLSDKLNDGAVSIRDGRGNASYANAALLIAQSIKENKLCN